AAARQVLGQQRKPSDDVRLAWALDQVGVAFPFEVEATRCVELLEAASSSLSCRVLLAVARLAGRWPTKTQALAWLLALSGMGFTDGMAEALRGLLARGSKPQDSDAPWLLRNPIAEVRAAAVACAELPDDLDALAHDEDASVRIALAERLRVTSE